MPEVFLFALVGAVSATIFLFWMVDSYILPVPVIFFLGFIDGIIWTLLWNFITKKDD